MSVAMPIEPVNVDWGRPFTRADIATVPEDGRRYELVDGILIVTAAPSRMHQRAVLRLAVELDAACQPEFEVMIAPFAVVFGDDTELQPDILVARRADLTEADLPAAPALAVEVLSPSTRLIDTHVKRERFEREGTSAFWIVDPVARPAEASLVPWELGDDGNYREVAKVVGDEPYEATVPYPVTVTPAALVTG